MPRNAMDSFHGNRATATAGFSSVPQLTIGYIQSVNSYAVTASVYLPSQNNTLKNLPISFNFMAMETGNISFPEIDSPVIVVTCRGIPPFILCSAGAITNYGVRSDLLESEQLFSNKDKAFLKQGVGGEQVFMSGQMGMLYQNRNGETVLADNELRRKTPQFEEHVSDVAGRSILRQRFQRSLETVSETDAITFVDGSTRSVKVDEESRAIKNATDMIEGLQSVLWSIKDVSEIASNKDLSKIIRTEPLDPGQEPDPEEAFFEELAHLFDFCLDKMDGEEYLFYQGAAPADDKVVDDVAELSESDLECIEGARTIYKAVVKTTDGVKEKFAVTTKGARIIEGDLSEILPEKKSTV